jgi:hypothetical protein
MSINPDNITTIRVDQLPQFPVGLTSEFPHAVGTILKKDTIQALVDLVATAVGSGSGVGFLPISVTDGQQLPNVPTDPSFFLCGPGTYLNINGYPDIVCTGDLNAVMSVTDHWQVAVEIPITVDLLGIGISQSVNDGVLDKAPSENAVYNFISQWLPKASLGYFDYADLATQTTPITVASGVQTLLTNDTLGDDTNTSQPPYGVTAIWDADSDEFNFQQLSVGDTVDIRIHLKTTTTTANQKYHIDMKFAFDSPDEFENRIFSQYVKNASEDEQSFVTTLYIGSESVRTYPARLYITSDDDATVEVVGWFCRVFRKNVNIVDIITDEAPIDGLTYGRKDAEWVEVSGGGGGGIPDAPNNANAYVRSALSWVVGYTKTAVDALLGNKVDANAPITGTVKTKITYDSKGLVIAGADALTSDIADSTNKRYVTDAQLAVIGNTSGTNTGDNATNSQYSGLATSKQDVLTDIVLGALINGYTSKTTPVGADGFLISNSADSNKAYTVSYTNLSATLKSYFDTLYATPALIVKRILNNTVETTPLTGTTSETLIYSAPVIAGGSFTTDDYFNFQVVFRKNANATACTYRVYVSNTNNFATASLLATWASVRFNTVMERRNLYFKADNTINSSIPATTSTQTDLTNSDVALTAISLNPANDIYFFVSAQLGASGENVKMTAIKIYN